LKDPGFDRSRITITESPLQAGVPIEKWTLPRDQSLTMLCIEQGPQTKGLLLTFQAKLSFKDGQWDITTTNTMPPPTGTGFPGLGTAPPAPSKQAAPGGKAPPKTAPPVVPPGPPPLYWVYYFRANQGLHGDDGPIRLMVLARFEGEKLADVFK